MHLIEPFYNWRNLYTSYEDKASPFYGKEYNECTYTNTIYNQYIHPQWDDIGSPTLFIKILYCNYEYGYAVIEMFGEWNDCLNNDIMLFKRNVIDLLAYAGINKYILIMENILNFHASDDLYYEEWFDDNGEGWIALINARQHVVEEFRKEQIDQFFIYDSLKEIPWRALHPLQLCKLIDVSGIKDLTAGDFCQNSLPMP